MDIKINYMDDIFIHMAPLPRRYPAGLPVQSIGYMSKKAGKVRHAFSSCNFSLILSGRGIYNFRGERFEIKAPCVITQWPGEPMDYGPLPGETWEELYMIFKETAYDHFLRCNLIQSHKPFWLIRRESLVVDLVSHLMSLLEDVKQDGAADRIDRACELLIVETRLGESRPAAGRGERVIRDMRQYVREHLFEHHDFDAMALRFGLSPSTFRRYWNRYMPEPPARYVMILRMREARRLLVETDLSIAEIAEKTGFGDPLYFSRYFSNSAGVPPSQYRTKFPR